MHHAFIQSAEADLSGKLRQLILHQDVICTPAGAACYTQVHGTYWVGLEVAMSCSVVMILPSLCLFSALLLVLGLVRPWPALTALAAAALTFAACNMARITLLGWVEGQWGDGWGFQTAHDWGGTLITIIAATAATGVFVWILALSRPRGEPWPPLVSPAQG